MRKSDRREFLAEVGRGMLVASVGASLAHDLGLSAVWAEPGKQRLTFGDREPLVNLLQQTPVEKLLPALIEQVKSGVNTRDLVAAGALANARAFGGQNYIGYHTLMALLPAYEMSREMPANRQLLPVFKVLYRNSENIQNNGLHDRDTLHEVPAASPPGGASGVESLREAVRAVDMPRAETTFAAIAQRGPKQAFDDLQPIVHDNTNVHRVVLALRAWDLLELTGREHAHTLLRQSVRFCIDEEQNMTTRKYTPPIRALLPKLIDQYQLLSKPLGNQAADDAWLDQMCLTILTGGRDYAADAVAAALKEGVAPASVAEAMSLAANQLVLRDPGRPDDREPTKPRGSVHGDSVGVHASDAANAWRHIAAVSTQLNTIASLIVGAYHTAGQHSRANASPYPTQDQLAEVKSNDAAALLKETNAAIRAKDQFRATALITRYGSLGHAARPVFDLLLQYATSEDGALHAEKYYRTVSDEFAASRPAFRWRHLAALARVTASEYGRPAPGHAEACRLLGVT